MTPTLVASCTALPPQGARLAWGGPALRPLAPTTPTPVASRTAPPPEGAGLARSRQVRRASAPSRTRGFTLIELLVAVAAMALMAGLSWRGLDGMVRAQSQLQQRADAVLTLQAGLTQWAADLDALLQLPQTPTMDWDGRALRIVRRSTAMPGDGVLVVAWTRRIVGGTGQWLRWQSPPQFTRGELQTAWARAAQWAQNPGDAEMKLEVRVTPLEQWQVFYFRGDAWTNPLSSDNATPVQGPDKPVAADLAPPDGVRLVLTLPASEAINGTLTRDWVRPVLGGRK